MIIIFTKEDLFEDRQAKSFKDVTQVDINVPASLLYNAIILYNDGSKYKLIKPCGEIPPSISKLLK